MSETHSKWMPLYVNDYLGDTKHLTTAEHGAYLLLLLHAWTRDGLLPADPERLRRVVGMVPREWKSSWPTIREFFAEGPDGFRHKRIDAELERARGNVSKRSEAGKVGAAKRWHGKGNADANAFAIANGIQNDGPSPSPSPSPSEAEEGSLENLPTPHGALAFSGRVIRLNQRDFDLWSTAYHGIPDLRAELTSLDDWLRDHEDPSIAKRWFHVVSGSLSKKHQAGLRDRRDGNRGAVPIC